MTGLACLIDDRSAHHDPSAALLSKWDSARLKAIQHQLPLVEEEQDTREQCTMSEENGKRGSARNQVFRLPQMSFILSTTHSLTQKVTKNRPLVNLG